MTYVKQTWADAPNTNTPISASRLAHMEVGIENASIAAAADPTPVQVLAAVTAMSAPQKASLIAALGLTAP